MLQKLGNAIKEFFHLVRQAGIEFNNDNVLKFSASLSYYTLFSLAPMLIIVISISSIWFGKEAAEGYLFAQFDGFLGHQAALQLQEMIRNAYISGTTPLATALGLGTLLFGATGVFLEIQDSINSIWSLKAKPKKSWLKFMQNRLLSFSLIVGLGFLLLVSLALNAMLTVVFNYVDQQFENLLWASWVVSNCINIGVVIFLFAIIFKLLPDATLKWRDVFVGALFTSLMFLLGKWGINYYLSRSSTISIYGAAGAVVLLILWIYYTSAILYFGAEFTKVYANKYGGKIKPNDYAVFIEKKEIQTLNVEASLAIENRT